jgi:hypothetical protein
MSERSILAHRLGEELWMWWLRWWWKHYEDPRAHGRPNDDVTIPVSLKLLEEIYQYLSEDWPKDLNRRPGWREQYKAMCKAEEAREEARLTVAELAEQRGIKPVSAVRRIKRRR